MQLKDKHYKDNLSEYNSNMDKIEKDRRAGRVDKRSVRERSKERMVMLSALKEQLESSVNLQSKQRLELTTLRKEVGQKRK